MIDQTHELVGLAASVVALLGIIGGWLRWVRPRWRRASREVVAVRDSILGRDAIVDSITGREIAPALPGIGQRVATIEQALVTLAGQEERFTAIEENQSDFARRLGALEQARLERVVTQAESANAWRAVAAAHGDVDPDAEPDL